MVVDGDGHFTHVQAVLVGEELHLGLDGEALGVEAVDGEGGRGEGPVAGLGIGDAHAGGEVGEEVEEETRMPVRLR